MLARIAKHTGIQPEDLYDVGTDTFFNSQSRKLAALTVCHAVPAINRYREFAAAGGLIASLVHQEDSEDTPKAD